MSVQLATFAGGCFWCLQHEFDKIPGILSTTVGYTGGSIPKPTYKKVCSGTTGHVEAIQVSFDPGKTTFEQLLDIYWHNIDPTQGDGQFSDIGSQYRPVIFYHDKEQLEQAEHSKNALLSNGIPVKVSILPASAFYPAEDYHQKYYQKSPGPYAAYAHGSGRSARLKKIWEQ